jgi:DNA-binding transcriptional MerR regulator
MHTIGEFAAFGRVSVRMLRHYDAIGLLVPADVDERTGYRRYSGDQLRELLRIVELRDLGCSLDDAAVVLRADDQDDALRAVLHRRRTELEASLAVDAARLSRLDARLRRLEGQEMTTIDYKRIEPVTVYAASGVAVGGSEGVGPLVDTILWPLKEALDAAGVAYEQPSIFWYAPIEGTDDLRVSVSWIATGDAVEGEGWDVVELPAIERAASTLYRGAMPGIGQAWMDFMDTVVADGSELSGPSREVYVESDGPQETWVTELQQPVR